ncbi:hypothetical protein BpHYR1_031346 [Brachionus plicatilis]|uniref:Uncharacterized protein n=1 Tax=Brachionus plicatilis TaxID=10195 RepID=A0A3M7R0A4_BRAPC|nr:hypothetical protein BpHYR1_031346 [Brachionus plicatilis]
MNVIHIREKNCIQKEKIHIKKFLICEFHINFLNNCESCLRKIEAPLHFLSLILLHCSFDTRVFTIYPLETNLADFTQELQNKFRTKLLDYLNDTKTFNRKKILKNTWKLKNTKDTR